MSELQKFLFDGLPVRGAIVRLTDAWTQVLERRAGNTQAGAYPQALQHLLGEMTAAAVLMQSNIKFNGALVLQVFGDGPVKLAVVEVQSDMGLRATAKLEGELPADASLGQMVNLHHSGRCAITLDPQDRQPGQQPYQGVVPLLGESGEQLTSFSEVLQHYMRQSEQLDTTLVLAANDQVAAGLLIQRLPTQGTANLAGSNLQEGRGDDEDYQRIAMLAASLKPEELLNLDIDTVLHRLFWEENLMRFAPQADGPAPHFHCSCSRERVARMLVGLGAEEAQSIIAERGDIEVGCEFCSALYRLDAVDVAALFQASSVQAPPSDSVQ